MRNRIDPAKWCAAFAVLAVVAIMPSQGGQLTTDLKEAASQVSGHPRLLIKQGDPARLRERAQADDIGRWSADQVIARADAVLDEAPASRDLQGRRMLAVSRLVLDRLANLSMAWQLTGGQRYLARATAELRAVSAFSDWNPSHFLDVAEMTLGVAIAYDWLHAELDEETREMVRRALMEKSFAPALANPDHWWKSTTNNWNQVCHGGLAAGALVMLDHEPDAALKILEMAVRNVPQAMSMYAPSGSYPEGPGYWAYGTGYNVVLLALLENALGTTFGLDQMEGFDQTGAFPILMTGPSGLMFNFSDGGANRRVQPAIYWLANRYAHPGWASHEDQLALKSSGAWGAVLTLLWRDASATPAGHGLPLHWTSRNSVPVSLHRESWDRDDAIFVGLKAGSPQASHGQMDAGSFILDANGIRWSHDLGAENYHRIESRNISLWGKNQTSGRWTVFRNNNLSHSTLVIDGEFQRADGNAPIVRFSDDPQFPHSVVDLTTSYAGQVKQAHRGVAMLPGGTVVVRDSLTGLRPGAQVRWAMATHAAVDATGKSTATLREGGEGLVLTLHGEHPTAWQRIDIATPPNPWDSPNEGMSLVAFTATAPESGNLDFTVTLHPQNRTAAILDPVHFEHPLQWSSANP